MASKSRLDLEMWALTRRQHGLLTRAQLDGAGFTRAAIAHRVRTGRLWPVHRDVFAVGREELTREGGWLAAVLACGNGAVLSHLSAGLLWEILEGRASRPPHVSVPTQAGRRKPLGVELHRTATLDANDITERRAIPVTELPRTLIDLATVLDDKQLKSALRQSERVQRLELARLRRHLDDLPPSSHGPGRLRRVLDAYVPGRTDSDLEAAFLELCAKQGLPIPETQVEIGPYRVDFLWRDQKLVVETDGRNAHDGFIAFREDRARDRALAACGLEVQRLTGDDVIGTPTKTARDLSAALERRSPLPR